MTNHWIDYQHSDVIMAIGVNTAENHPMSMRWIERARERGAKLIAIDPRLIRTAAVADIWLPLRPGTDIALLGGLINYTFENKLYQREYVANYTNAAYILREDYDFANGVFSGFGQGAYDRSSWQYELDEEGRPRQDPDLEHPRCVFRVMEKHYSRYDRDTVCNIVGCHPKDFERVASTFCATGAPGKAGNILYAMGITQSTHGSQNVRATAVLQLLLGNIGIPGGGVNAQRGEANVQGSTDMAMLYHILPGYLSMPQAKTHPTYADYLAKETPASSYWANKPKFMTSLLKAWWGESATDSNDYRYDWLPKLDGRDRSHIAIFEAMAKGEITGMFVWGQNPAVGGPQASLERKALENLDWMVAVDIFETETASFWRRPGVNPEDIKTEVFLLPAAASYEKDGSVSNSGRWIQWRYQAILPPGDAKSDLWIADKLYRAIRDVYLQGGVFPDPIVNLSWNYSESEGEEPDIAKVASEINGYNANGKPLENFTKLAADGSTVPVGCSISRESSSVSVFVPGSEPTTDPPRGTFYVRVSGEGRVLQSGEAVGKARLSAPENGYLLVATGAHADYAKQMIEAGRTLELMGKGALRSVSSIGNVHNAVFVNPLHPDVRAYELSIVEEICRNYAVDGIVLDRMRYPNIYADFSELSRKAVEQFTDSQVTNWPEDVFVRRPAPCNDETG